MFKGNVSRTFLFIFVSLFYFDVSAGFTASKSKCGFSSPTESYLSQISWRMVASSLGLRKLEINSCKLLVNDLLIPREKEFSSGYSVFYHGQKVEFSILYDLQRYLNEFFTGDVIEDFEFLRQEKDYYAEGGTAIDFLKKHNYRINNRMPNMKKILLSVNLSFPGDLTYHSSTLYYYFRSKSARAPFLSGLAEKSIKGFYPDIVKDIGGKELLDSVGLKIKDIEQEFSEQQYCGSLKYGNLLQIFVPKNLVDKCAYISQRGGSPKTIEIKNSILSQLKKAVFGKNQEVSNVLNALDEDIVSLKHELPTLQARLLLHKDLFNNYDSGIKIFRYNQIPQNLRTSYQSKLRSIAQSIFSLWTTNHVSSLVAEQESFKKDLDEYLIQKQARLKTLSQAFLNED